MSKRNRGGLTVVESTVSEQVSEQPEEQPEVQQEPVAEAEESWEHKSDSQIMKELERRLKAGNDKENKSGRIRELKRMGVEIKHIVKLLDLNQFQHAYVVIRKAGLITPVSRTPIGTCNDCGKPIYTQESLDAGKGTLCRHKAAANKNAELEEEEAAE